MVVLGKSVAYWLFLAFIAICLFFLFQWLIPLIFSLVGFGIPPHIVNILALLIAAGVFGYGYAR